MILLGQGSDKIPESAFPFHQKVNRVRSCSFDNLLPTLLEAMREEGVTFEALSTPFPWKWVILGLVLSLVVGVLLQVLGSGSQEHELQVAPAAGLVQQENFQGSEAPEFSTTLAAGEDLTLQDDDDNDDNDGENEALRELEEELKRRREALGSGKKRAAGARK